MKTPIASRRPLRVRLVLGLALAFALALGGSASAAPSALTLNPTSLTFGDQDIDAGATPTQGVNVTNSSGGPVGIISATIGGADASEFSVASESCSGATLNDGDSCEVTVHFDPTSVGAKSATLTFTDTTGTADVLLQGNGITGTLGASPVTFQPQPFYFGDPQAGVNLAETTNVARVHVAFATFTGPDAARFYVQFGENCVHQAYFPGNSCSFGIAMHAAPPGTYTAALEVTNDGNTSPLVIPLSVTELAGPKLTVTPSLAAFGDVGVGQERAQAISVVNAGDFQLPIQQVFVLTGWPDVFSMSDDSCSGQVLPPGATCGVMVHFRPSFLGPLDASLFFISGEQGPPVHIVSLNGTGTGTGSVVTPPTTSTSPPASPNPAATPPPSGGTVSVTGKHVVGGTLRCRPRDFAAGANLRYRWLRNGHLIAGQTLSRLRLTSRDTRARIACQVVAPLNASVVRTSTSSRRVSTSRRSGERPGGGAG